MPSPWPINPTSATTSVVGPPMPLKYLQQHSMRPSTPQLMSMPQVTSGCGPQNKMITTSRFPFTNLMRGKELVVVSIGDFSTQLDSQVVSSNVCSKQSE
jgi:hypothetical protein